MKKLGRASQCKSPFSSPSHQVYLFTYSTLQTSFDFVDVVGTGTIPICYCSHFLILYYYSEQSAGTFYYHIFIYVVRVCAEISKHTRHYFFFSLSLSLSLSLRLYYYVLRCFFLPHWRLLDEYIMERGRG